MAGSQPSLVDITVNRKAPNKRCPSRVVRTSNSRYTLEWNMCRCTYLYIAFGYSLETQLNQVPSHLSQTRGRMELPRQSVYVTFSATIRSAESRRLLLRPIAESDVEALFAIRSRPEVARYKSVSSSFEHRPRRSFVAQPC